MAKIIRPAFAGAPQAQSVEPKSFSIPVSAIGVWVLIVASGALCCWYYIDANETPYIMVPLTIGSEIIGARWASHAFDALKNERHAPSKWTRFIMGLACLLLAAIINVSGAHRAIEHLNANANREAIKRDNERLPYEAALARIDKERQAIPILSASEIATMPTTRFEAAQERIDNQKRALDEQETKARSSLANVGDPLPLKSELNPGIAFALEFLKLFGLFTCASEGVRTPAQNSTKSAFSERTQKGWETRRRNQALKHPKYKGKSASIRRVK